MYIRGTCWNCFETRVDPFNSIVVYYLIVLLEYINDIIIQFFTLKHILTRGSHDCMQTEECSLLGLRMALKKEIP